MASEVRISFPSTFTILASLSPDVLSAVRQCCKPYLYLPYFIIASFSASKPGRIRRPFLHPQEPTTANANNVLVWKRNGNCPIVVGII
jgi:hypothetical protein